MRKLSELEKLRRESLRRAAEGRAGAAGTEFPEAGSAGRKPADTAAAAADTKPEVRTDGTDTRLSGAHPADTRSENPADGADTEDQVFLSYCSYIADKRKQAAETLRRLNLEEAYRKWLLRAAQDESRALSVNGEKRSTPATRRQALKLQEIRREKDRLLAEDPDFFAVYHEEELRQDLADERAGRLVSVPYLQRARKQVSDSLEAGIPVYLVGHLGSGKTQLAIECATDYMRGRRIQELLTEKMAEHGYASCSDAASGADSAQPGPDRGTPAADPDSPEAFACFCSVYPEIRRQADSEELHPYFIAGSHNLTAEDMFFEKTLKLSHASGKESNEVQLKQLISGFWDFVKQNESIMADMTKDQQLELMLAGWKTFSNIYIAENSGYGTTVEKIEKEVLKALKEGKPIIIDEINTIAMSNLIALNDILQHHAGQTAYITGVGSLTIKPGFCLIGTGNLSTGTVSYEGTNVLNPAFQSRFTTVVYNYVPQTENGDLDQCENPRENELFRLVLGHLCNTDGSLQLPQPEKSLPALWHLSQMARLSQDIFEGRSDIPGAGNDTPVLNEAVLSIRGLIHVLDHWNFGEEEDLSMALWNGFLSSVTNADDRNLLLSLAVRYGFFKESDGWHIEARSRGSAPLSYDDIRTTEYRHVLLPLKTLSSEDVTALLFGDGPKRTQIDSDLGDEILIDESAGKNLDLALALDDSIRGMEQSADLLGRIVSEE